MASAFASGDSDFETSQSDSYPDDHYLLFEWTGRHRARRNFLVPETT